jgi:RNA polymerase sigma factor (sigma-70 family)
VSSDFELLDAWNGGDQQAGEALFERHFEALYVFFHSKTPEAADDLIQATFLACVQARHTFRRDAAFRTFLFAIARNQLFGHLRKTTRRGPEVEIEAQSLADLGTSPSRCAGRREEERLLAAALRLLPLDLQLLVELYYWEHLTAGQLAVVFDVPEGTVRTRLKRARELLGVHIERAAAADLVHSTLDGLERWTRGLRDEVAASKARLPR